MKDAYGGLVAYVTNDIENGAAPFPHWGDLLFAKALGFEAMHETQQAIGAFSPACERGKQEACKKARAEASGG